MLARDHGRRRPPRSRSPGFLIALRTKGETVDEVAGLARTMRALATPVDTGRDDLLDTAGHRRRAADVQRLDDGGADRRRRRLRGGQARQPLGHEPVRLGRRARGARRAHRPRRPRRSRDCIRDVGFGFMFAPVHHQATRFVVPVRKELAVRTIFNFLGPLTNPAGATRQLDRRRRPGLPRHDRRRARAAGRRAGAGSVQRRRTRRDEHRRDAPRSSRSAASEHRAVRRSSPATSASDAPRSTRVAGGTPDENAAITRAILAGEPGPQRDLAVLNAGAAIYAVRARRLARRRACAPPRRRSTTGGGRAALERLRRAGPASWRPRMSVLDRIVESTRHDVERRRREVPASPSSSASSPRAATTGRSPRRSAAPGYRLIAEHKRRSPSARARSARARRRRRSSQAYERGGAAALSILTEARHFGGSLDDLREARAAVDAADPAQGLHRRPLPAVRVRGGRRRRGAADRRRAATRASSPRLHARGARARPRRARRGPRRARARGRARGRRRGDRHQQPRPDRLHRRHRAHLRAARGRAGGQDRRRRSRASRLASSSTSSSASASTRCSSARRSCARPTSRPPAAS